MQDWLVYLCIIKGLVDVCRCVSTIRFSLTSSALDFSWSREDPHFQNLIRRLKNTQRPTPQQNGGHLIFKATLTADYSIDLFDSGSRHERQATLDYYNLVSTCSKARDAKVDCTIVVVILHRLINDIPVYCPRS
jgi:hypothetical protein